MADEQVCGSCGELARLNFDLNCASCAAKLRGRPRVAFLTKREHFAALAMQGLMASEQPGEETTMDVLARSAVRYADALLLALEQVKP